MHIPFLKPKALILAPLLLLLALAVACGDDETPTPVVVEVEKEVVKEVVKEVEVIKEVVKEVVKEVEVPVEKEVIKEVEKEVVVTVVATPTPAPKAVEAKVRTLKISIDPVFTETNLIWETHPSEHANQARHWMDPLVEMDPFTGKMVPGLATEWEILTPDAKNWLVKLREDVPFHKGWGEFTAKDVVFTHIMIAQEGGVSLDTGVWQRLAGTTEPVTEETAGSAAIVADVADNFKIIDDHTLEFNLNEKNAGPGLYHERQVGDHLHDEPGLLRRRGAQRVPRVAHRDRLVAVRGPGALPVPGARAGGEPLGEDTRLQGPQAQLGQGAVHSAGTAPDRRGPDGDHGPLPLRPGHV